MKQKLLIIAVFGVVLALVALVGLVRAMQSPDLDVVPRVEPTVVRTMVLEPTKHEVTDSFHGVIEPLVRLEMGFQVPGRVVSFCGQQTSLLEGTRVNAGEVIARLDPERYTRQIAAATARRDEAASALQAAAVSATEAETAITEAEAVLADARSELERLETLAESNVSNKREVERSQLLVTQAEARLESAKALASRADAERARAEAAIASAEAETQVAAVSLDDAVLKAPRDAIVARVGVEVGEMVPAGQAVMTLVDLDQVILRLGVSERRMPDIHEGQRVRVRVYALRPDGVEAGVRGRMFDGVVRVVPPIANEQRLFEVEVQVENGDELLKPGMIAEAVITTGEREAVAVPASAGFRTGDEVTAFFVEHGHDLEMGFGDLGVARVHVPATVAKEVRFTPRAVEGNLYLVDDLPGGLDELVVEGQSRLSDGEPVVVLENPSPS